MSRTTQSAVRSQPVVRMLPDVSQRTPDSSRPGSVGHDPNSTFSQATVPSVNLTGTVSAAVIHAAEASLPIEVLRRTGPRNAIKVRQLQEALHELGYITRKQVDGGFGSVTEGAVKSFQYEHGLDWDGVYGEMTRQAMVNALVTKRTSAANEVTAPDSGNVAYPPVSDAQLAAIMPHASRARREAYLPALNKAMERFGINTPLRQAAFLAQVSAETGDLRYLTEMGDATELQNRYKGYHGRGMLQLTWKENYLKAGNALGLNLVAKPRIVATDADLAALTAAWYFSDRKLNVPADAGRIGRITLLINGGYNGIDARLRAYDRAVKALMPAPTV